MPPYVASIQDLKIGMYVRIAPSDWIKHPFLRNSVLITNEAQIRIMESSEIQTVTVIPEKSQIEPQPTPPESDVTSEIRIEVTDEEDLWDSKNKKSDTHRRRRDRLRRFAAHYQRLSEQLRTFQEKILQGEDTCLELCAAAEEIITRLASDTDVGISLIVRNTPDFGKYSHSVNVACLSYMLGNHLNLPEDSLRSLILGAFLHDVGKITIKKSILNKPNRNKTEEKVYTTHTSTGHELLSTKCQGIPDDALAIVLQHNENFDGSGFPKGLKGDEISPLAQIVAIANAFDNRINNVVQSFRVPPFRALSMLYGIENHRFNLEYLATFIRVLGIYPPGSILQLSDGSFAVVNAQGYSPKNPLLVVYDMGVPRDQAIELSLEELGLDVEKAMDPLDIPPPIREYLLPSSDLVFMS